MEYGLASKRGTIFVEINGNATACKARRGVGMLSCDARERKGNNLAIINA